MRAVLVVIAGLSGSGRSEAANCLEDLGFFVVDNLPPALIPKVTELAGPTTERLCLAMGTERYSAQIGPAVAELRASMLAEGGAYRDVRLWFLEAGTQVLVQRYETTRRRHPFASTCSVQEAIEAEREALSRLRAEADLVIDTSDCNVHDLRRRIVSALGSEKTKLNTRVVSFSYRHGLPPDVDMVFDCRFLPNPHWEEALRPLDGIHPQVQAYVASSPVAKDFLKRLDALCALLLPAFEAEGKSYLTLAFGCTGGKHRSVYLAEFTAEALRKMGFDPQVQHRDLSQ